MRLRDYTPTGDDVLLRKVSDAFQGGIRDIGRHFEVRSLLRYLLIDFTSGRRMAARFLWFSVTGRM